MRSSTPSPRRHRARRPHRERLEAIARIADEATLPDDQHLLLFVEPAGDDVDVGVRPLDPGEHPFSALAGFTAPDTWAAVGVRASGTARFLDDPAREPERTATTFLVDRQGHEASLLRTAEGVQVASGPMEGTIPDACRRVLGLATAPPPPSTAVLWTLAWLDRLLTAWGEPVERRHLSSSWEEVARRHPALDRQLLPPATCDDPSSLVRLGRAHAAAWPWHRLRAEPHALDLPDGSLPVAITSWMDDGFYARWAVGSYPPLRVLATDLPALLGEPLGPRLIDTALALLD